MSPLLLDSTQLIQMNMGELTLTEFTMHFLLKLTQVISLTFHTLITTISTTAAPQWVPNCCMVLQLEMFVQGLCVERDKISGYSFSFNTLFSTWQQTEEY